jgi:uncharacterized integral membrane protein
MVTITKEQWDDLLEKMEDGEERSSLLEGLLNQGYSLLEAEAIYLKALGGFKAEQLKEAIEKKTFRRRVNRPSIIILLSSLLVGCLLSLFYLEVSRQPFSFLWGFPWMFYEFGNWLFCFGSGNLPGWFGSQGGSMVAECHYFGATSPFQKAFAELGGFVFVLIVGLFLIVYMLVLSQKTQHIKEMKEEERRVRYAGAWFNGTVGFACLSAVGYAVGKGLTGEMYTDTAAVASAFGTSGLFVVGYVKWVFFFFVAITLVIGTYLIVKDLRKKIE